MLRRSAAKGKRVVLAASVALSLAVLGVFSAASPAMASDGTNPGAGNIKVSNTPVPGTGQFTTVIGYMGWFATVLGVIGLLAVGMKLMIAQGRGQDVGDQMSGLGKVCAGLIVCAAAGPVVAAIA